MAGSEKERKRYVSRQGRKRTAQHLDLLLKVSQLRLAGMSQIQVARQLGVNPSSVSRCWAELDELYRERAADNTVVWQGTQLSRLDEMLMAIWADAKGGKLGALDRVLAIVDRQVRLQGIEPPTRTVQTQLTASLNTPGLMETLLGDDDSRRLAADLAERLIPAGDDAGGVGTPRQPG